MYVLQIKTSVLLPAQAHVPKSTLTFRTGQKCLDICHCTRVCTIDPKTSPMINVQPFFLLIKGKIYLNHLISSHLINSYNCCLFHNNKAIVLAVACIKPLQL